MKTAECEGVEEYAPQLARAKVVTVLSFKDRVATIDYGNRTVVCGASNCRAGMKTVWLDIGKKIISGVESDGMLAAADELGISRDHSGVVEIDSLDLQPDWIIEIDNKSLTHRPDLWGHFGMAREVAALTGARLTDPVRARDLSTPAAVNIDITDFALCPRYSALVFDNVTVQPSPLWLQYRLQAIGLNPINNIVDVTNYVMAELAQPMHAFDAAKITGDTIIVRTAKPGERILALNGETYDVGPANLLIADAAGPIAIAGVIGGNDSAISASTKRIIFESANFNAASVRRTSSALKLRTDASMRFEKSQDPENTVRGLLRAAELLEQVSPGIRLVGGLADAWQPKPAPAPITLNLDWLNRKLGHTVPAPEVRRILDSLGFTVTGDDGEHESPDIKKPKLSRDREGAVTPNLSVTVPSWRATKDISLPDDLVEEVGRMIGYATITPQPPMVAAAVPPSNEERGFHHRLRDLMTDAGFTEVYNYSFISDAMAARWSLDPSAHIRVLNPIAEDQNLMRTSLLPRIGANIEENAKHFDNFRLFEIGNEIHKNPAGLPDEVPHLVAVIYSKSGDGAAGLFELKRVAQQLLPGVDVRATEPRHFEHPARTATIGTIGRLFELHPNFVEAGRAAVLDIDLHALHAAQGKDLRYTPIRRYPTSAFDLSIVTALRTPVGDIERDIRAAAQNLVAADFLRQYSGPPLPDSAKSVSFRVTIGDPHRTLSSEEITAARTALIDRLKSRGHDLRV
jgi:phenylalanyl-tRNA synthetase beta chain